MTDFVCGGGEEKKTKKKQTNKLAGQIRQSEVDTRRNTISMRNRFPLGRLISSAGLCGRTEHV